VPTSCSWRNAVEGFFAKLTRRRFKQWAFPSIVDRQAAINRLNITESAAAPLQLDGDPEQIVAAVRRGQQTVSIH